MRTAISFDAFDTAPHFPSLDGLRALCVLLVMFNHIPAGIARPPWVYGYLGVDVFFVLSGFLITTLLLRERRQNGRISLKGFYCRRFFRIVPVYLFAMLLYFLAVQATQNPVKMTQFRVALPWLLSFMQEYRPATAGNILGHSWTLGIEEKFYAFWPPVLILFNPRRVGAPLAAIGVLALFLMLSALPAMYARSYGGLLIGAVLAFALSTGMARRAMATVAALPELLLGLLVIGTYLLAGHDHRAILLFSLAVAVMIASLLLRRGSVNRILESRTLVYIGKRSYAMYLIHVLVADVVARFSPSVLPPHWMVIVLVSYALTLAGACLLHVTIEKPCIDYGRRLALRFSPLAVPQPGLDGSLLRPTL